MRRAISASAEASRNTWQTPASCLMTGIREVSTTLRISPWPPRGMIRSTLRSSRSSQSIASRSVTGTMPMASSGMPVSRAASRSSPASARLARIASEPPRRITAFPALRQSAAASTVTLGRDS